MTITSRYFYNGSPFIPSLSYGYVNDILNQMCEGVPPVVAISYILSNVMAHHVESNIFPKIRTIHSSFGTDMSDLLNLRMGYEFPFDSVIASAAYTVSNSKEGIFKDVIGHTQSMYLDSYYKNIRDNIDITRDLLSKDCTGISIFMYLEDRPFLRDDYFLTGQQVASVMLVKYSEEVANRIRNGTV